MNTVATKLEIAKATAPYVIEKERYQMAIDEINLLQAQLDEIRGEDDPADWKTTIYQGRPWHADECGLTVRMFCEHAQVLKAPKKGTLYAEYWPNPDLLQWMLRVMNEAEERGDHSPAAVCPKWMNDGPNALYSISAGKK
jgi:hypothetical protein